MHRDKDVQDHLNLGSSSGFSPISDNRKPTNKKIKKTLLETTNLQNNFWLFSIRKAYMHSDSSLFLNKMIEEFILCKQKWRNPK